MPISYDHFSERMRRINDYAGNEGFISGFPTKVTIYKGGGEVEAILLNQGQGPDVRVEDVSRGELKLADAEHANIGARFRRANDYAEGERCFGFPNFHQRAVGSTIVYGTVLILRAAGAIWRDVPISSLGNVPENEWEIRFRRTHDYAVTQKDASGNNFIGGYPNGHQANYGAGVVNGTILIPQEMGTHVTITLPSTSLPGFY